MDNFNIFEAVTMIRFGVSRPCSLLKNTQVNN